MITERWQVLLSALAGAVVFILPWLLSGVDSTLAAPLSDAANWNLWIGGAIIVILSLAALVDYRPWEEWISILLGAWLVASPWIFGFTAATAMAWSVGVAGVVLAILGLWSLAANSGSRPFTA